MKSEKKIDKSQVELTITLDEGEWKEIIKQAAVQLSEGVNIAGFRPGKAPQDVVINHLGETRIVSAATETAINKYYALALQEHDLAPIILPKISVDKVTLATPLVFKAEVVVMPQVELGDYSQIRVPVEEIKVNADRIDGVLKNIQRQQAKFDPIERAVQMGDWVEIDFEGKMDGKVFEGGSSKSHPLIVGDGVLLPDFENALVGMKTDEEKTFPVTFPMDYHKADFAGKSAEFTAKLHKIKEVKLPELNDEFAQKSGNFKTLSDLKADISKFLSEDAQQKENDRQKEAAILQLIDMTKVELPDELVKQEIDGMMHDFEHQLEHQQMNLADYLKKTDITEAKLREQWQDTAKKRVIAGLALDAFKRKEGIEISDDEVAAEIERLKNLYPTEKDNIEAKYTKAQERTRLKTLLTGQKAIDQLWEMATKK